MVLDQSMSLKGSVFRGGEFLEAGVRNNIYGEIEEIKRDNLMAQVTMWVGGWTDDAIRLTSVMTGDSLEEAGFAVGDKVNALVKAINVVFVKH